MQGKRLEVPTQSPEPQPRRDESIPQPGVQNTAWADRSAAGPSFSRTHDGLLIVEYTPPIDAESLRAACEQYERSERVRPSIQRETYGSYKEPLRFYTADGVKLARPAPRGCWAP